MIDRRWLNPWLAVAICVLIYFGTYRFFAEPKVYRSAGVDLATGRNLFEIEPRYVTDDGPLKQVFAPAHRIDRWLRRDFWKTVEDSSGRKWQNPAPASEPGTSVP